MRQKHNLFTEVGFARPGANVDKKSQPCISYDVQ